MSKFVDCNRNQAYLLPPDLRDWIPEDDLAHFVIEAVERVPMSAFQVNERGTGSAQYHPQMMLALLIYCYANGIFSSRRIERATHRDIGVRFVAANRHPDHDTIATFRRRNLAAVSESFLQVLLLAREMKLLKVGMVSVDGTKLDANASKHRSVRYDRAGELTEQLNLEIEELMARAEASDGNEEEDPQALPEALAHKERLRDRMEAARQRLEARARDSAEAERAACAAQAAAREAREEPAPSPEPPEERPPVQDRTKTERSADEAQVAARKARKEPASARTSQPPQERPPVQDRTKAERTAEEAKAAAHEPRERPVRDRRPQPSQERPPVQTRSKARQSVCETKAPESHEEKARPPPPPKERPKAREQDNLSDPDSRLMRRSKHHEFRQAYNAQATVDAEGSQLILGTGVSQSASDRRELVAGVTAIPAPLGRPTTVLADNGYASGEEVARLAEMKVEALVATGTEGRRRRHDFRPAGPSRPARQPKAPWLQAMAERLASKEGRDRYRLRQQTVEPVFGIIKSVLGFRRFSLRGIEKVNGEWDLVAVAYNCKRLHKLQIGA